MTSIVAAFTGLFAGLLAHNPALPNPAVTPGAVNHSVMQSTIDDTICIPGYARSIRPNENYTYNLKRRQMRVYGHYGERLGLYEEDHLIPLSLGGNPVDDRNLWPQPRFGDWTAELKDQLEYTLWRMVCAHRVSLREAQSDIAHDWIAAYRKYVRPADLRGYRKQD
jgi:hypothetical protein